MSIKAKIQVDSSEVKKGLQEAENTAKKAGINIKDSMEKAGQGFESINKLGGTMGGTLKNVQEAIMGLLSPVGLVMAGLTALGTLAIKVWDNLTVSAEEYAMKASNAVEKANKNLEEVFKQEETDAGYLERLKELASAEDLSNAMKVEAVELISILTKKYGDLGLSIDIATGKIMGLDNAQRTFLKRQQELKVDAAKIAVDSQRMAADSAAEKILGVRDINSRILVSSNKFGDRTDVEYFHGLNGALIPHGGKSRRTELWNKGGLEGKLQVANEMIKNATSSEDIENWEKLSIELEKLILAQKEYNYLVEHGERSEKAYAEALKKRSEQITASKIEAIKKNQEETQKVSEANVKRVGEFTFNNYDDATKLSRHNDFISTLKKKQEENLAEIKKIDDEIAKLSETKSDVEKVLAVINFTELKDEYIKIGDKILELDKKRTELALNQVNYEAELIKYEEMIAKIKKKNYAYYDSQKKSLDEEIKLADLKLKGLDDEIAKQKLLYDIKSKGIMLDEKEVETIIKKQKELGALNLKQDLKGQAESLQIQAMKAAGKGKEAAQLEAIRNAEKIKGLKLTEKEIEQVKKLSDLQYELGAVFPSIQVGQGTITNELARRGGFASSVVTDTSLDVNTQILAVQKAQESLLKQIDAEIKKLGVIA